MMRFLSKLLMNAIVVVPLLMWFTEATFLGALLTALVLSALAYVVGDQLILRMSNNTIATIADALLTFLFLWIVASFSDWSLSFTELLIITAAVGVVEMIFHRQLGHWDRRARA